MKDTLPKFRRAVYRRLPRWLKDHDFEVLAALVSVGAGLPILFGQVEPRSVEEQLPAFVVTAWALVLTLGGFAILVGILAASRSVYPQRVVWMRVEALGLTALAYFCYIYVICIAGVALKNGWSVGVFVLGFGAICHVRKMAIFTELEEYRTNIGLEPSQ